MPFRERLRRFTRSDRSSSTSSQSSTTLHHAPTAPIASLAKSSSRLNLSKTLTFAPSHKKTKSREDVLKEWEKKDKAEWNQPTARRPGRKSQKHQDVLRAFEWGFGKGDKNGDAGSVISPCTSRIGSVDDGKVGGGMRRVMSGGSGRLRLGSRSESAAQHVERVEEE